MADVFVVMRRYGPPYANDRPLEAQPDWEAHRTYINAAEAAGFIRVAGPIERGDVLLVVRAESEEEIERHLAADPWTASGLLTTTRISRWDIRVGEVG